jgi:BirA family biotin operon repressor/biotin-[acetyl-CoA-carboxylase] ligase
MQTIFDILKTLADGQFHSVDEIAAKLNNKHQAIYEISQQLLALGIECEYSENEGYKISNGLELMQENKIRQELSTIANQRLSKLEILDSIDSTNRYLIDQARLNTSSSYAVLAEHQSAGKGRHGRVWQSPYGSNIYLSLLWNFSQNVAHLASLSLVVAVIVINTLKHYGIFTHLSVKWPNDILWSKRKLAGILLNTHSGHKDITQVVIGIGLNLNISSTVAENIDQAWVDIQEITQSRPQRNRLAGLLLNELLTALPNFAENGFTPFLDTWNQYDIARGKTITIHTPTDKIIGIAQGINLRGELLILDKSGKQHTFLNGEVSLRIN